jgi:hypothetical protein
MNARWTVSVLALIALAAPLFADEPEPRATKPIAQLVAELDDENFIVREQATRMLLARGPEALAPLKDVLEKTTSPEVRARARHVLQMLSIHDGGGEVINGLKIRLHADTDKVRPGTKVRLTTTLCNVSDRDLNVQVGYSTCGNYFDCGANLRALDSAGKETKVTWRVDVCGNLGGPIFATVPARGTLEYTSVVQLQTEDDVLVYAGKYVGVVAPRGGVHRLCMVLSAAAGQGNLPAAVQPANPKAGYWTGDARSNLIELEVVH